MANIFSKIKNMTKNNQLVRFHPGLSTALEARNHHERLFSDHLPFVTDIPIGNREKPLKLISWNVLEVDRGNGFADKNEDDFLVSNYGETPGQEFKRHQRIAQAIKRMTNNTDADVILLQEIKVN